MTRTEKFARVEVTSASQLRAWLGANHGQATSVWLVTFKKHVPEKYVSVAEILDELLCFGWIDGVRRKLDENRTMQLISPRQTQHWAKSYKVRAEKLEREGRMQPAGRKAIALSKRNGLWTFLDDVDALLAPADLTEALEGEQFAADNFAAFGDSYKRNVLRWIKLAKTPATREKRIAQTARFSARNDKIPQV